MAGTLEEELKNIQLILKGIIGGLILLRCLLIVSGSRREGQPVGTTLEQCRKVVFGGIIVMFIPDYLSIITGTGYFSGATSLSSLGKQILNLAQTSADLIIALSAVTTTWNVVKEGFAWFAAADEQKRVHTDNIKNVLIKGVLILSGSVIVSTVLGYFT